jgi:hypothetical protein
MTDDLRAFASATNSSFAPSTTPTSQKRTAVSRSIPHLARGTVLRRPGPPKIATDQHYVPQALRQLDQRARTDAPVAEQRMTEPRNPHAEAALWMLAQLDADTQDHVRRRLASAGFPRSTTQTRALPPRRTALLGRATARVDILIRRPQPLRLAPHERLPVERRTRRTLWVMAQRLPPRTSTRHGASRTGSESTDGTHRRRPRAGTRSKTRSLRCTNARARSTGRPGAPRTGRGIWRRNRVGEEASATVR